MFLSLAACLSGACLEPAKAGATEVSESLLYRWNEKKNLEFVAKLYPYLVAIPPKLIHAGPELGGDLGELVVYPITFKNVGPADVTIERLAIGELKDLNNDGFINEEEFVTDETQTVLRIYSTNPAVLPLTLNTSEDLTVFVTFLPSVAGGPIGEPVPYGRLRAEGTSETLVNVELIRTR